MKLAKIIFIYTVLAVFVGVSSVGILAATGVIKIPDAATVGALIGPCLGIVATVIQAKHIFDDPDAISKLKEKHHEEILGLKASHAEREAQSAKSQSEREAQIIQSHLAADAKNKQTIKELERRVADLTPPVPKPVSPSAGGGLHGH